VWRHLPSFAKTLVTRSRDKQTAKRHSGVNWIRARPDLPCPLYRRKRTCAVQRTMSAKGQKRTLGGIGVRSFGIVTFNSTSLREHSFDGAFPYFFGWILQSGQVLGGELYQGGGARKF
jgi:hypothetical protein